MSRAERYETLTRVGPGTRVGALFRSIWMPALLSSQLPSPGCAPVRLRLLCEDLVAFRSGNGELGITQANCAHRLAPLFYGQIEDRGIRCAYHGWLYGPDGQCREMLNEPDSRACAKVKLKAYEVREKAGVIWIYMGEGEPPSLPAFPWMDLPESQRNATVWLQESNWLQGLEGELDSSHVSILHTNPKTMATSPVHRPYSAIDIAPKLSVKSTDIGMVAFARRNAGEQFYWRVSQFMLPAFSSIPSASFPVGGRAYIPIDDDNAYTWDFNYDKKGELPPAFLDYVGKYLAFPPEAVFQPYRLNTGSIIDVFIPVRTAMNNYLIDREGQSLSSPSGIHGLNDQDRAMQEGMAAVPGTNGRIANREREFLVSTDIAIVQARRRILEVVQDDQSLKAFQEIIRDGSAYAVEPLDVVSDIPDPAAFFDAHADDLTARI